MSLRYRDGVWLLDGEPVTQDEIAAHRDALAERWAADLGAIAIAELGIGGPRAAVEFPLGRVEGFAGRFVRRIADMIASSYAAARGGVDRVTDQGWATVVALVDKQSGYAAGFVDALKAGSVSEAQAVARARSYAGVAVEAFSAGMADQIGFHAPAHPTEGCAGGNNCRCYWDIVEYPDRFEATWKAVGDSATCDVCQQRARDWSPLVQRKSGA